MICFFLAFIFVAAAVTQVKRGKDAEPVMFVSAMLMLVGSLELTVETFTAYALGYLP